jgi:hypothetical protein
MLQAFQNGWSSGARAGWGEYEWMSAGSEIRAAESISVMFGSLGRHSFLMWLRALIKGIAWLLSHR